MVRVRATVLSLSTRPGSDSELELPNTRNYLPFWASCSSYIINVSSVSHHLDWGLMRNWWEIDDIWWETWEWRWEIDEKLMTYDEKLAQNYHLSECMPLSKGCIYCMMVIKNIRTVMDHSFIPNLRFWNWFSLALDCNVTITTPYLYNHLPIQNWFLRRLVPLITTHSLMCHYNNMQQESEGTQDIDDVELIAWHDGLNCQQWWRRKQQWRYKLMYSISI